MPVISLNLDLVTLIDTQLAIFMADILKVSGAVMRAAFHLGKASLVRMFYTTTNMHSCTDGSNPRNTHEWVRLSRKNVCSEISLLATPLLYANFCSANIKHLFIITH